MRTRTREKPPEEIQKTGENTISFKAFLCVIGCSFMWGMLQKYFGLGTAIWLSLTLAMVFWWKHSLIIIKKTLSLIQYATYNYSGYKPLILKYISLYIVGIFLIPLPFVKTTSMVFGWWSSLLGVSLMTAGILWKHYSKQNAVFQETKRDKSANVQMQDVNFRNHHNYNNLANIQSTFKWYKYTDSFYKFIGFILFIAFPITGISFLLSSYIPQIFVIIIPLVIITYVGDFFMFILSIKNTHRISQRKIFSTTLSPDTYTDYTKTKLYFTKKKWRK